MDVITDFLSTGQKIGIAVSGGMDSMALLHWFFINKSRLDVSITAINIDHNIRASSYKDSDFVKDYCKKSNIDCLFYKLDLKENKSENNLENAARLGRYEIFHNLIQKKDFDYIATAHHAADNAETVLMHLFRGSGLKGACGISLKTQEGIIRPLLYTEKQDIEKYIIDNNIPYVTDETNLQTDFDRNYVRLEIMPKIKSRFSYAVNNINSFSKTAKEDNEYIEHNVPNLQKNKNNEVFIPTEHFEYSNSIINREIFCALKLLGINHDIEAMHIELIKSLIKKPSGTNIDIKGGIIAVKDYKGITLTTKKANDYTDFNVPFILGKIKLPNGLLEAELTNNCGDINFLKNSQDLYIDADNLPNNCCIRYRQSGDFINKLGEGGKVSLKDYFIDKKILARKRNTVPVLAKNNQIYAIIGITVSQDVRVTNDTIKIYKLKFLED